MKYMRASLAILLFSVIAYALPVGTTVFVVVDPIPPTHTTHIYPVDDVIGPPVFFRAPPYPYCATLPQSNGSWTIYSLSPIAVRR